MTFGLRLLGGVGACKCCRCTNCCSGHSPAAWYVDTTGATDGTCTFCDEAVGYVFYVDAIDANPDRCEWEGTFGDTSYWVSSDVCQGTIVVEGLPVFWQLRFFVMRFYLTIFCLDDETYRVTATITQEWSAAGFTDPVACCGFVPSTGQRRSLWHYSADVPRGSGDCAAWSEKVLTRSYVEYQYWDTVTDPMNPAWRDMAPNTYSPCQFPSTIKITAA